MHNHSHVIEFSIGVSFVLGVLHALEPGHGKSAMFVYMLQQRKSFWHPIVMGVTTGLSHAASLMVIALAVHLGVHLLSGDEHAGHQHAGEALQWISSVLLVGIGLRLLYLARRGKISKKTCSCCREAKVAPDSTICSTPAKPVGTSMRMTVLLGIAVGLLPCPTALAAYFAGVSSGNPAQGYLVIGVFSAGIASSLILCGFLFQFVGSFFRSINRNRISANTLATIQAMAIIAIGSFYISQLIAG